jgi:hypothetical protein
MHPEGSLRRYPEHRPAGRGAALLVLVTASLSAPATVRGDDGSGAGTTRWEPFPPGHLYRPYVADVLRPQFSLAGLSVLDVGIADSGDGRSLLQAGGRFGLVRRTSAGVHLRAWQLSLEAGVNAVFDTEHNLDNIGWDGLYGLVWTAALGSSTAVKIGINHISSHIGDELAERTGRRRIDYTRQEVAIGVRHDFGHAAAYVEGAWGADLRTDELQDPGRLQAGVEIEGRRRFWGDRFHWLAALDLNAWEERKWSVDTSVWAGIAWPRRERTWRIGMIYRDGRVPLGELFQDDESYVGLGLWLDV